MQTRISVSGIYLHIPFCKQACHYCDFHFSTSLRGKDDLVRALVKELELRRSYLHDDPVASIYFGGGTPSLLEADELSILIQRIRELHPTEEHCEITIECNPDDLNPAKLDALLTAGVNRISIGVQSFDDDDLIFMNRAHSASMALDSIKDARRAGFRNITIDLIYGTPGMSDTTWDANLSKAIDLDVQHISSYALTVEQGTRLFHDIRKGKSKPVDDEQSARQFERMLHRLTAVGYEHYEISNFSKPGFRSLHNTSYWLGKRYLGIGPSAHSFDGETRSWNISNNQKYTAAINSGRLPQECEELTETQRINEYILTGIRTSWGIRLEEFESVFGTQQRASLVARCEEEIEKGQLDISHEAIRLTDKGKLMADYITARIFADA